MPLATHPEERGRPCRDGARAQGVALCVGGEKSQLWFALGLRGQGTVARKRRPGAVARNRRPGACEESQARTPAQDVGALGMEGLPEGEERTGLSQEQDPQGAPCGAQEQQQGQGEAGGTAVRRVGCGPTGRGQGVPGAAERSVRRGPSHRHLPVTPTRDRAMCTAPSSEVLVSRGATSHESSR